MPLPPPGALPVAPSGLSRGTWPRLDDMTNASFHAQVEWNNERHAKSWRWTLVGDRVVVGVKGTDHG